MKVWGFILGGILMCICPAQAGIVAVVNDVPLSDFDVTVRAKMLVLQDGKTVGEVSDALKKQALELLIEEQIKRQKAESLGIVVSDAEIDNAIAHLEDQNGMAAGRFLEVLTENGIPVVAFRNQIRADLGWLQMMRRTGEAADVRPADIAARRQMMRKELAKESLTFAEIVVKDEKTAVDIWQQLQDGADFRTLAETVSVADSKTQGGQVRDVTRHYYGESVAPILGQMAPGQLSRPIQVSQGYAVILMLNKRAPIHGDTVTIWELMQVIVPADYPMAQRLARPLFGGCDAFVDVVQDVALPNSLQRGQVSPDQLPGDLKALLDEVPFKEVVGPVSMPAGDLYLMKCDQVTERVIPDDAFFKNQIEIEQMTRLSQRLLAEARRDVVIEYKE